jgi:Rps23 Pro-64 3,4-dihydroxylase Tpa1-like proline 4-hydroxylase
VRETFEREPAEVLDLFRGWRERYLAAEPFPHACFSGLISENFLQRVQSEFPEPDDAAWKRLEEPGYSHNKMISGNFESQAGQHAQRLFWALNSGYFLQCLENLTGIRGLISDPYGRAGGLHQYTRGGYLEVHTDFNYHPQLKLYRRLNLILYLNRDWKPEYGGDLILRNKTGSRSVEIFPGWNQMMICNIGPEAHHGFPTPLTCPEGITRKSLAVFYYTAELPLRDRTYYIFNPPQFKGRSYVGRWSQLSKALLPPLFLPSSRNRASTLAQLVPPILPYAWYRLTGR